MGVVVVDDRDKRLSYARIGMERAATLLAAQRAKEERENALWKAVFGEGAQ